MNVVSEFKVASRRYSFLGLAIFVALIIACQDSQSSNTPTQPTEPPAVDQPGAPMPTAQPKAANVLVAVQEEHAKKPAIEITEVPAKGGGNERIETIAGTVRGVKTSDCKVVIFAQTDVWYVQPYIAASDTAIKDDNTWRTDTHLGVRYAALLVKKSYKPPTTTGKLPEVGGMVLAIATANAKE